MKTIHKYVLETNATKLSTYEGVRWLHAAEQHDEITVWAEVNTLERECLRTLHVVGTGQPIPTEAKQYLGSAPVAGGHYVFHVYAEETR